MLKINNKTPERRRRTGVFIMNFEHISHLFLVFLLLNSNRCLMGMSEKNY